MRHRPDPPTLAQPITFSDFPYDVQINILSFLAPPEISAFASTCRRSAALCRRSSPSSDLWLALHARRWACSDAHLRRLPNSSLLRLYQTLNLWEQNLIGFCLPIYVGSPRIPPFVFFQRTSSCIVGYRISPSAVAAASYAVCKTPFLWLGLSPSGETLSYVHKDDPVSDSDVIPVSICFTENNTFVVQDEERLGGWRWKPEHFINVSIYFRNPTRPLQGLWKGISEDGILNFYLVTNDDVKGLLACGRIGESDCAVVFFTSNSAFLESPFSDEELAIYSKRKHFGSLSSMDMEVVSRIFRIHCSHDYVEGRIWEYEDGTFGFGFFGDNFIIDLKHIALDGHILDVVVE